MWLNLFRFLHTRQFEVLAEFPSKAVRLLNYPAIVGHNPNILLVINLLFSCCGNLLVFYRYKCSSDACTGGQVCRYAGGAS